MIDDLPISILYVIYSKWISTIDLARLDTALCSALRRSTFRSVLNGFYGKFLTSGLQVIPLCGPYRLWLNKRNIFPLSVNLRICVDEAEKVETFNNACDKFVTISTPLECVNVEYMSSFTSYLDKCVSSLHLSHLNISKSPFLFDDGMTQLLEKFSGVKILDLSYCINITDLAIVAISNGPWCPQLLSFSVSQCYKLGDAAVSAICQSATRLTSLDISGCFKVTDTSITVISLFLKVVIVHK